MLPCALPLVALATLASVGCGSQPGPTTTPLPTEPKHGTHQSTGRLRVTVSVDWEGAYLSESGVEELVAFREALPEVPITHWICPAYLVKDEPYRGDLRSELEIALRDGDETALHIHGWASLAKAAGVARKGAPSFFKPKGPLVAFEDGDDGFDLELGAYNREEFIAILHTSETLLATAGVTTLPMFRGGAGILEHGILETLAEEGYLVDTSLIQSQFWRTEHGAPPQMGKRVEEIWGVRGDFVEPFWIETSKGKLLEIPSAPGFGDYSTAQQFVHYIDAAAAQLARTPNRDVYIHFGFHQENADLRGELDPHTFQMRVQLAVRHLLSEYPELVVFERMSDVARRHGAKL